MNVVNKISDVVYDRLVKLGYKSLNLKIIRSIIQVVHTASLITEEGQFIQGSITLADPSQPDKPPYRQRADYPKFTALQVPEKLTPEFFVKIARAVDKWSGSIAVWGEKPSKLIAWGIVDQLVETNKNLNRETIGGFPNPGILTIQIDRPGDLTIYHQDIFLGSIRSQRLVLKEAEAFDSDEIINKLIPVYEKQASVICSAVNKALPDRALDEQRILGILLNIWKATIARICIGLRRSRTGGTLIITDTPKLDNLSISRGFNYDRLSSAITLQVLDDAYESCLHDRFRESESKSQKLDMAMKLSFAETDTKDREDEVTGAVKLVTSLAAMDGAILMKRDLSVIGFGVKIGSGNNHINVYDAEDLELNGKHAKKIDTSQFGTRHNSLFRYCSEDANAIGVVISQDGHIKIVSNVNGKVILWDRIQLLNHLNFTDDIVSETKEYNRRAGSRKKSKVYGYSEMPKSIRALLTGKLNNS